MTYSSQFLRVSWIFSVNLTAEIAVTSLDFSTAGAWAGASAALAELSTADMTAIAGYYLGMMTVTGGRWADYSHLDGIKIAAIGTDGHYVADVREADLASPAIGTTIGNPIQCTQVVSLRSNTSVGKGNWGRMFLPHFYMSVVTAQPFTDNAQALGLANAASAFITNVTTKLNASITDVIVPVIMGQTGTGTKKVVSQVRVGNVIDTQRRRRDQLTELYSVSPA